MTCARVYRGAGLVIWAPGASKRVDSGSGLGSNSLRTSNKGD